MIRALVRAGFRRLRWALGGSGEGEASACPVPSAGWCSGLVCSFSSCPRGYKYVPLAETIRGFKAIVDGEMDEYPEAAFFNVGTIDEVKEKYENIQLESAGK